MITSIILYLFTASCVTDKEIAEMGSSAAQSDSVQAAKDGNAIPAAAVETVADTPLVIQPAEVRSDLSALEGFRVNIPMRLSS